MAGRPLKRGDDNTVYEDEGGYIATNEFALKLLELIIEMSNYKIIAITGPSNTQKKALKKTRKIIEKEQAAFRKTYKIHEEYNYFLRDPQGDPRKYTMKEGRLQEDERDYVVDLSKMEKLNVFSDGFLGSLKLLFQELNPSMQIFLQEYIYFFSTSDMNEDQFDQNFLEEIESNHEKYKEILQWDQLYEMAYDEKVKCLELDLNSFTTKFKVKETTPEILSKVGKKRLLVVKSKQEAIDQFKKQQNAHRPLKLFLSRLMPIFKQHQL